MEADAFAVFGVTDRELCCLVWIELGRDLPIAVFYVSELTIAATEVFGLDEALAFWGDFDDGEEAIGFGFVGGGIALPLLWRIFDFFLISTPVFAEVAFPISGFFDPFVVAS